MDEFRKYRKAVDPSSFFLLLFFFLGCSRSVEAYTNYTVGDSLGWYDKLLKPSVDYQNWASSKNFSLGDFLIFNTDSNHSVIQTYNFTTYDLCDYNDAADNDTYEWSAVEPSNTIVQDVSVSVPLVKEGMNFFFSGNYDGEQCENGQRFKINVAHGQGLPESLGNPTNDSPGPISPESGNDESAPETMVPSNFDNPREESDSDEKSGAGSLFPSLLSLKLNDLPMHSLCMLLLSPLDFFFPQFFIFSFHFHV